MSKVFFAKVNVNKDIYKVYEKKATVEDILSRLVSKDWQSVSYQYEIKEKDDNGNRKKETAKFIHIDKFLDKKYIVGRLVKIYKDDIQLYDKKKDDVEDLAQTDLARSAAFYFDLNKEIVGFVNKQKLSKKQFIELFQELINLLYEEDMFVVISKKNEIEFEGKVKLLDTISRVDISLIPPNSSADEFTDLFPDNSEEIKESGSTKIEMSFSAPHSEKGLKWESEIFKRVLWAIEKGWGKIKVIGKTSEGLNRVVNSDRSAEYKREIDNMKKDNLETVKDVARAGISELSNKMAKGL